MAKEGKWWTYPCEAENGRTIIVSGQDGLDRQRLSGKYVYRLDVSLAYPEKENGLPDDAGAGMLENITDAFRESLSQDKVAVMTGIYTGDGRRDWVFYTRNLRIFNSFFNRAMSGLPLVPFEIEAEEDPGWEEYLAMREETYIPDDE